MSEKTNQEKPEPIVKDEPQKTKEELTKLSEPEKQQLISYSNQIDKVQNIVNAFARGLLLGRGLNLNDYGIDENLNIVKVEKPKDK